MRIKIVLLSLILLLFGCTSESTEVLNPIKKESIDYETLNEYLKEDVTFLLYIGREDCTDCIHFDPILEKYLDEHDMGVYYLDIKAYRDASRKEDASKEEIDFFNHLYKQLDFNWTPTIKLISNGKYIKDYTYLDEDYYEITEQNLQKEKEKAFVDAFYSFMDDYSKSYLNETKS